jgi:hypothetical protein
MAPQQGVRPSFLSSIFIDWEWFLFNNAMSAVVRSFVFRFIRLLFGSIIRRAMMGASGAAFLSGVFSAPTRLLLLLEVRTNNDSIVSLYHAIDHSLQVGSPRVWPSWPLVVSVCR